jgi:hypothetical protein
MEYKVSKRKTIIAGLLAGTMLCLAAVLATAVPAAAQDDDPAPAVQYGNNIEVGDINTQVCNNIIGDINIGAEQYSGGNLAIGDGNVQAIAQEQNVSFNVVQSCINLINSSLGDDPPDDQNGDDNGTDDGNGTDDDADDEEVMVVGSDQIIIPAGVQGKTLANTGGIAPQVAETAPLAYRAATLIPAGALLMVMGITTMLWLKSRRA